MFRVVFITLLFFQFNLHASEVNREEKKENKSLITLSPKKSPFASLNKKKKKTDESTCEKNEESTKTFYIKNFLKKVAPSSTPPQKKSPPIYIPLESEEEDDDDENNKQVKQQKTLPSLRLPAFCPPKSVKKEETVCDELTSCPDPCTPCKEIESNPCSTLIWPKRITVSHIFGEQEGGDLPYTASYTTLGVFIAPDYRYDKIMPFLDLNGQYIDKHSFSGNIGLGGRYFLEDHCNFCRMLGANLYYDFRKGGMGYFQQLGLGFEFLGSRWDFRANAYIPIGNGQKVNTTVFDDYIGDYVAIVRAIESVSNTFNAEVGYLVVNGRNFSLYTALGPYLINEKFNGENYLGIEARIRPMYLETFSVDLSVKYDQLFGAVWQAEVGFTIPLYQFSCNNCKPCGFRDWQIYQPVKRLGVMPISKRYCWKTNW